MRLLFAGTPETALPSLAALMKSTHEVLAVLTRPDAPAGRGRRFRPSPVAELAREAGVEVLTPRSVREPTFASRLAELAPDCAAIVAYGALIPAAALALPAHGWVNLHFSLLPAWRGAAPVQHAILAGDEVTGATTFRLDEGMDTGPVFGVLTEAIRPRDTAGELLARLAVAGAELLVATLDGIEAGTVVARAQPADGVSLAPKLRVEDARIDWQASAVRVDRLARAASPDPGAWTTFRGQRLKVGPVLPLDSSTLAPGRLSGDLHVGTGTHDVALGEVQAAGKPWMAAEAWARGARLGADDRLS